MADFDVALESSEINVTLVLERTVNAEGGGGVTSWDDLEDKPTTFPPSVHNHDDLYFTESEVTDALAGKSNTGHNHDDRYYTETEIDTALALKQNASTALALGETSSTAYRGDRGKTAYDHSQVTGNPHGVTKTDVGLANVPNTDATARANHTGTQTASTISDFNTAVDSRLTNIGKFARQFKAAINDYFLTTVGLGASYSSTAVASSATNSNGRGKLTPFYLAEATTIDAMALYLVAVNDGAGAVVRMGIYKDNDGRPGNVVVDAGTASINGAASLKTLTFTPVTLQPGFYWAVAGNYNLNTGGVNPTYASVTGTQAIGDSAPSGGNNMFPVATVAVTGALTNSPAVTLSRSTSAAAFHIWIRRSA